MYEENNTFGIPAYFKNLHLGVAAITGKPRIMSIKPNEDSTDKYINIPDEEWHNAILSWANHLEHGYVQVLDDYTFCIAGKATSKRHLIQGIKKLADELEGLINSQLELEVVPNKEEV